jgi:branched-chain amino acid transport system substrate-binding protein
MRRCDALGNSIARAAFSRRQFLKGALGAGLSMTTAGSLLAGCGGGEASAGAIKLGVPLPLTGTYAGDGEHCMNAITLAVEEMNEKGGVLGKQLTIVPFDIEEMTPEKLNASAEQLVVREGVDALLTSYAGFGPDVAAYGKYDVPFIYNDATEICPNMVMDNYEQYKNCFFQSWWAEKWWGIDNYAAIMAYPYDFPEKTIALCAVESDWDSKINDAVAMCAERDGWTVLMNEVVPYGTQDFGPLLARMRAAKPALVKFESLDPNVGVAFVRQFMKAPMPALLDVGYSLWWTGVLEALGSTANGVTCAITQEPVVTDADPEGDDLKKRYTERWGTRPYASWVYAYDTVGTWAQAAEVVGNEKDYAAVGQAILDRPYVGEGGTYLFDADRGNAVAPSAQQPNFFGQVQDGGFVPLYMTGELDLEGESATVQPWPFPEWDRSPYGSGTGAGEFVTPPWLT